MTRLPPRDWTDIHWAEIAEADAAAMDRGAAAGGDRAARAASAARDRRADRGSLSRAGARIAAARLFPATFLPVQPIGISTEHIDYPGTLTLPTEVALKNWMALGESVARDRYQEAGDGHQPRRQQRGDDAGGAGSARAARHACGHAPHGRASACRTACSRREEFRHGIHGGAVETSIMLARYPRDVRRDAIADFRPASIAMEKEYRWLSTHRPAPFAWQAQDLHPSGAAGDATQASAEKGERLLDHGARAFCELLEDVDRFDVSALRTVVQPEA